MDILIEESQGALWAAAVQKGRVEALEVDTVRELVRWGDIYQARVKTIDKARDAAFLDLGEGQTGILYNKNLRLHDADGNLIKGGDQAIGKMIRSGQTLIVQAKTSYIESEDDRYTMEHKIAEVSMDISLQGRYLIYCPLMRSNRLSQRITEKAVRESITEMMPEFNAETGYIFRAAAAYTQTDILKREASMLQNGWESILKTIPDEQPQMLAAGLDAVQRILSDSANSAISAIEIVTMEHLNYVEHWCSIFAPDYMTKINPIEMDSAEEDLALFHERDIMSQIDALTVPYCKLAGGGNLIIQPAAALTAIDVNKGADNRSTLDVNIEAAQEALRQIRLRNLGGVIMIDALRMRKKADKDALLKAVRETASLDPCTVQIHGLTNTGLIELTRNRRTAQLDKRMG